MTTAAAAPILLALAAAITHATWNFLLKRAGGGDAVVGLSKVAEAVVFAPFFVVAMLGTPADHLTRLVPLAVIGAVLTGANYVFLGRAYATGQFSLVYPVSRGAILLVLPVLGWMVFRESIDPGTALSIALILAGILVMQLVSLTMDGLRQFGGDLTTHKGTGFALLAATAAAGYTVWDKRAVQDIAPFTYFYGYTLLVAAGFALQLFTGPRRAHAMKEWRAHRTLVLTVGVLNTVTYLLVLFALRDGHSTRIVAVRQLSIAIGAWLGWTLLQEAASPPRRLGVALILAGTLLVAIL